MNKKVYLGCLVVLSASYLLVGCGKKIHYKKYEYEKRLISFDSFDLVVTVRPTRIVSGNCITYRAPYELFIIIETPSSNCLTSISVEGLKIHGVASHRIINLEDKHKQSSEIYENCEDELDWGLLSWTVPESNRFIYEDLILEGELLLGNDKGRSFRRWTIKVDIPAKYSEEEKNKFWSEIMGI